MMSPSNPLFGSKGQDHESWKHCRHGSLHYHERWLLLVCVFVRVYFVTDAYLLLLC